jgi:hypothetical protein
MGKLLVLKNCFNSKLIDGKTICTKKLFGFKIYLAKKTSCIEKLFGFQNWLDGKLLVLKTTWIQNLIGWEKIACIEKLLG